MIRTRAPGFARRHFLKGLGAAAMAPLLPILNAEGQETLFPKRLLLFFTPDGTAAIDHNGAAFDWRPQGTETDFNLSAIHAPLNPFKSKIVIPYGMRFSAGGAGQEHAFGMSGLWSAATLNPASGDANFDGGAGNRTGWGSGPSIDQVVAEHYGPGAPYSRAPSDPTQETAYRTLELGVQCQEPHSMNRMIYKGNNQPLHPEVSPRAAFDRYFANLDVGNAEPTTVEASAAKRASMDLLMAEVERLRTKVGSQEYVKIESHLSGLSGIARRLETISSPPIAGCQIPNVTIPANNSRWENSPVFPDEAKAMMDMAAHLFACDLTRVASVQLNREFSQILHSWVGATQGHHTISHNDGDNRAILSAIDTWYAEQFAYMLGLLDSIPEGNGTLLDNTLVVWGRGMATTSHKMQPMPLIMAGSARGELRTGRYLTYDREPHARALVSIGRLMGMDINSFGNRDVDSGPLANLI